MHELGIVFHIIRTVEDVARQNDVTRIRRVTLQLGEVSGVVESYLHPITGEVVRTTRVPAPPPPPAKP